MLLVERRLFLQRAAAAAATTTLPRWAWSRPPALTTTPFALGVASGDPLHDGMVLWTRLLLTDPAHRQSAHTVRWEVAHDPRFQRIVRRGQSVALPELGHSVHTELQGLAPDRWYFYRFMLGDAVSPAGRTRTAPAPSDMPSALRVAFASCQRWEHGHYAAWRHLAADQPDLVLFLGDYIYEYPTPRNTAGLARTHTLGLATTLADYRDRYALHKSDTALQQAHAACPWAVTWDDHEVQNDYAGLLGREERERPEGREGPEGGRNGHSSDAFFAQRSAAYQAFYENMPLRASSLGAQLGTGNFGQLQVYRRLRWGRLAHLHLLDARQSRSWQACRVDGASGASAVRPEQCPELAAPHRSLLGTEQERWLSEGLADDAATRGTTRWTVLAQQTLFSARHYPSGVVSTDSWGGYPAARARLLAAVAGHAPRNTVLLGGDIHQNYVCRVHAPASSHALGSPGGSGAPGAPGAVLASEFCGTSISSRSGAAQDKVDAVARHNPHVLLARSDLRGYGLADITPALWTTSLRVIADPLQADSPVSTLARFVVEDGRPGPIAA